MELQYRTILSKYAGSEIAGVSSVHKTIPLHSFLSTPAACAAGTPTHISVINADMLDTALSFSEKGHKTLVLNMANPDIPGGSPCIVGAQEEDLFRRTNLHKYLPYKLYPLYKHVVLSTDVEVAYKGIREKYAPLETPVKIDIISAAAVRNIACGIYLRPSDARTMYEKIHAIFKVALENKYDTLVLSAFGCGGFNCPPEHVSAIFKRIIELDEFKTAFQNIVFAIWDESHPKCNHAIFKKTLCS